MMAESVGLVTRQERLDRIGVLASTTCALHCAACALIPAAFATFGLELLLDHKTEWLLTGLAVSFGLMALVMGWRAHRNLRVMIILSVGIIGLLSARMMEGHGHHDAHADHPSQGVAVGDHHAEKRHESGHHAEKHEESGHRDEAGHDHHGHGGAGEGVGIFAGLILMMGHLSNLQAMRRRRETPDGGHLCCGDCDDVGGD